MCGGSVVLRQLQAPWFAPYRSTRKFSAVCEVCRSHPVNLTTPVRTLERFPRATVPTVTCSCSSVHGAYLHAPWSAVRPCCAAGAHTPAGALLKRSTPEARSSSAGHAASMAELLYAAAQPLAKASGENRLGLLGRSPLPSPLRTSCYGPASGWCSHAVLPSGLVAILCQVLDGWDTSQMWELVCCCLHVRAL